LKTLPEEAIGSGEVRRQVGSQVEALAVDGFDPPEQTETAGRELPEVRLMTAAMTG
jgi:hypothetical protein